MFALSNTILTMSAGTRELSMGALLNKESAKNGRILVSRICMKDTNRSLEVGANHGSKLLIYIKPHWEKA